MVADEDIRQSMAETGRLPDLVPAVDIEEAFFHCAKCIIRSGLWEAEPWADVEGLPSLARAMVDHGKLDVSEERMAEMIDEDEQECLYQNRGGHSPSRLHNVSTTGDHPGALRSTGEDWSALAKSRRVRHIRRIPCPANDLPARSRPIQILPPLPPQGPGTERVPGPLLWGQVTYPGPSARAASRALQKALARQVTGDIVETP